MDRRKFLKLGGAGVFGAALFGITGAGSALAQSDSDLTSEFEDAASEYGVPVEVLLAMGYVSTRWETPSSSGEFNPGDIHGMGGYGVMALSDNPDNDTLAKASKLTGIPQEKLRQDRAANIRGAAAVLASVHGQSGSSDLDSWYESVSEYGDGQLFADQVYDSLSEGASEEVGGSRVAFGKQDVEARNSLYSKSSRSSNADYKKAQYYGAANGNYSSGRGGKKIDRVVIHVMQGPWSSAVNWFNDPRAGVSAHYNVRSSDGFIGQSVRENNTGHHAGDWPTNQRSVGIEHEGYVSEPGRWFTDAMYKSSAKLTAYLCRKYDIPISRRNIIGHHEVPGCSGPGGGYSCHTDPGGGWNWSRYMQLVERYAKGDGDDGGGDNEGGAQGQVIDNSTSGRFKANTGWKVSSYSEQRYGANYRYADPTDKHLSVGFKVNTKKRGTYKIYTRWPALDGYNPKTLFRVKTVSGYKERIVNQRKNGGKWVLLGDFDLAAGDNWVVEVSRKSTGRGYVIADAIRVVAK